MFLPVALVAILVGIDVRARLDRLDAAERSRNVAEMTRGGAELLNAIGREVSATSGALGEGETRQSLAERRQAALSRWESQVAKLEPGAVGPELTRAVVKSIEAVGKLEASRNGVNFDRDQALDAMDSLADLPSQGARSVSDPVLSRLLIGWSGVLGLSRTDVEVLEVVEQASTTGVDVELVDRAAQLRADIGRNEGLFRATWPPEDVARTNSLLKGGRVMAFDDALEAVGNTRIGDRLKIDRAAVIERLRIRSINREVVTRQLGNTVVSVAEVQKSQVRQEAVLTTLAAVAGSLAVTFLALLLANRLTRRIRKVTRAADQITDEYLPALVSRMATGEELTVEPISLGSLDDSKDEVGRLGTAIEKLQGTVIEVADSQTKLLRRGVSDIFVKLARRNQRLLERQLHFLDELEAGERDPDQLRRLFHLDHLATRMRRNAENLLVIAGADPGRRSVGVAALAEVVQAAVAETEDFNRFAVGDLDDVFIDGRAVVDVVHLVAELLENAAQFSPPTSRVQVVGIPHDAGFIVRIADVGLGMDDQQLAEANALLDAPPALGLSMSRTLGLVVVARLAQRHGVRVVLQPGIGPGTEALILLPLGILNGQGLTVEPGETFGVRPAVADQYTPLDYARIETPASRKAAPMAASLASFLDANSDFDAALLNAQSNPSAPSPSNDDEESSAGTLTTGQELRAPGAADGVGPGAATAGAGTGGTSSLPRRGDRSAMRATVAPPAFPAEEPVLGWAPSAGRDLSRLLRVDNRPKDPAVGDRAAARPAPEESNVPPEWAPKPRIGALDAGPQAVPNPPASSPQVESAPSDASQTRPSQVRPSQVRPSQVRASQVRPSAESRPVAGSGMSAADAQASAALRRMRAATPMGTASARSAPMAPSPSTPPRRVVDPAAVATPMGTAAPSGRASSRLVAPLSANFEAARIDGPGFEEPPKNFTPHLHSGASALPKRTAAVPGGRPAPVASESSLPDYGAPLGYGVARRNQSQMDLLTGLSRAVARGQARRHNDTEPGNAPPIRAAGSPTHPPVQGER